MATITVGTAAITENSATNRVCNWPVPIALAARAMAMRRDSSTISAMAGIRLAISSSAICGGDSIELGVASRLSIQ